MTTTKFIQSICSEDIDSVQALVEEGVDVTANNNEAVILAVRKGFLDILKYLESNGANLKARNEEALVEACKMKHLKIIKYLFSKGFSFRRGYEALGIVHERRYEKIKAYLQEKRQEFERSGDEVEVHNSKSFSLMAAICDGKCDVVQFFLESDYLTLDNQDEAVAWANSIDNQEVKTKMNKMLKEYFVKESLKETPKQDEKKTKKVKKEEKEKEENKKELQNKLLEELELMEQLSKKVRQKMRAIAQTQDENEKAIEKLNGCIDTLSSITTSFTRPRTRSQTKK